MPACLAFPPSVRALAFATSVEDRHGLVAGTRLHLHEVGARMRTLRATLARDRAEVLVGPGLGYTDVFLTLEVITHADLARHIRDERTHAARETR